MNTSQSLTDRLETPSVVIGVPSFRRPEGLTRLLESIARLRVFCSLRVVVAENDLVGRQAVDVVNRTAVDFPVPLTSTLSEEQGISGARNALVRAFLETNANILIMLDDDQWVEDDWLELMLQTWRMTGAHLVGCKVVPDFLDAPSTPVMDHPIYWRRTKPTGLVDKLTGSGGVLIEREVFAKVAEPWFDPAFSRTGGEDNDFFIRARKSGCIFAVNAEAIAHEVYPHERVNEAWVAQRIERIGMSDIMSDLKNADNLAEQASIIVVAIAAAAIGALEYAAFWWVPKRRERARTRLLRSKGKFKALAGRKIIYYK